MVIVMMIGTRISRENRLETERKLVSRMNIDCFPVAKSLPDHEGVEMRSDGQRSCKGWDGECEDLDWVGICRRNGERSFIGMMNAVHVSVKPGEVKPSMNPVVEVILDQEKKEDLY